jgi:microcystin-dependent protein
MSNPYIGEIRMFGGSFPPAGWAFCNGATMPISENETLFQLIGTTYGGDGQETFNLPDLQSRVPVHMNASYALAQQGGVESVTLTTQQIPNHTHPLLGSTGNGAQAGPAGNVLASSTIMAPYANESADSAMAASSIGPVGGSQPHENVQPYLVINYIISLFGIFPSPT